MQWKDTKVSKEANLIGHSISSFCSKIENQVSTAKLRFDNGWLIFVMYAFEDETTEFKVLKEA